MTINLEKAESETDRKIRSTNNLSNLNEEFRRQLIISALSGSAIDTSSTYTSIYAKHAIELADAVIKHLRDEYEK